MKRKCILSTFNLVHHSKSRFQGMSSCDLCSTLSNIRWKIWLDSMSTILHRNLPFLFASFLYHTLINAIVFTAIVQLLFLFLVGFYHLIKQKISIQKQNILMQKIKFQLHKYRTQLFIINLKCTISFFHFKWFVGCYKKN